MRILNQSMHMVAVVTGGASGIGLASCKKLAKKNYKVVVSDINESEGEAAVAAIKERGAKAIFLKADVSKYDEVKVLIEKAVGHYGQIDLLVNNAGIGPKSYTRVADHTLEDWNRVIAVNQSGVFYGMKAVLPYMVKQKSGNIVNISSVAGIKASTTGISYAASKFAVVGMTKSAALEYARYNIRINCVCPSFTHTPLFENDLLGDHPQLKDKLLRTIPQRRFAETSEIADAICWLASGQSTYVTGLALPIDGGISL